MLLQFILKMVQAKDIQEQHQNQYRELHLIQKKGYPNIDEGFHDLIDEFAKKIRIIIRKFTMRKNIKPRNGISRNE